MWTAIVTTNLRKRSVQIMPCSLRWLWVILKRSWRKRALLISAVFLLSYQKEYLQISVTALFITLYVSRNRARQFSYWQRAYHADIFTSCCFVPMSLWMRWSKWYVLTPQTMIFKKTLHKFNSTTWFEQPLSLEIYTDKL